MECIAKGKARTPYEFGVKVSVAVTVQEWLVVDMRSMPGLLYDGHTVDSQLEQIEIVTGRAHKGVLVGQRYRGVMPASGPDGRSPTPAGCPTSSRNCLSGVR